MDDLADQLALIRRNPSVAPLFLFLLVAEVGDLLSRHARGHSLSEIVITPLLYQNIVCFNTRHIKVPTRTH